MMKGRSFDVIIWFMVTLTLCSYSGIICSEKKIIECDKNNVEMHVLESIKNNSTINTYIKLRLFDSNYNREIKLVIRSADLSNYMMNEYNYTFDEYVEYFIKNKNNVHSIVVENLKKNINLRFNNQEFVSKYFQLMVYENVATFKDLGVKDEPQLLEKYFDFNAASGGWVAKFNLNIREAELLYRSEVLAFLIDLGYQVYRGDIVPNIHIKRYCK